MPALLGPSRNVAFEQQPDDALHGGIELAHGDKVGAWLDAYRQPRVEWAVSRRYMPVEKLTAVCNDTEAATMIAAQ